MRTTCQLALLLFAVISLPSCASQPEKSPATTADATLTEHARAGLDALQTALRQYAINNGGKYPASLEPLVMKDANGASYLAHATVPTDPWGQPYVYAPPSANSDLILMSFGADGQEGGEGADTDITVRD